MLEQLLEIDDLAFIHKGHAITISNVENVDRVELDEDTVGYPTHIITVEEPSGEETNFLMVQHPEGDDLGLSFATHVHGALHVGVGDSGTLFLFECIEAALDIQEEKESDEWEN